MTRNQQIYDLAEQVGLFKGIIVHKKTGSLSIEDVEQLVKSGLLNGIAIDPAVFNDLETFKECELLVDSLIARYGRSLTQINSTFFKTFKEASEVPDSERFFLQMLHYASTYGDIEALRNSGEIFEPKVLNEENWNSFKNVIDDFIEVKAISVEEAIEIAKSLLTSGIALSEDDLQLLMDNVIKDNIESFTGSFFDEVSNREARARLYLEIGEVPTNFDELMKVIFYAVINHTVVINNKNSKFAFKIAPLEKQELGAKVLSKYVEKVGIEEASKHVTRYRDFIVLLKNDENRKMVNRLMKLSKINYVARKVDPLGNLTSNEISVAEMNTILNKALKSGTLNIYRLVRIINAVRAEISMAGDSSVTRAIKIRNNKIFVKEGKGPTKAQAGLLKRKEKALRAFIPKLIGESVDGKVFVFDETFVPSAPTSGKSFSGFLPEYSYFRTGSKRGVLGIAWEHSGDLDLHASTSEQAYGWNSQWSGDEGVVYTGDMTRLNKYGYAAEFYQSHLGEGELLNFSISQYSYNPTNPYKLIIASGGLTREITGKSILESTKDIIYAGNTPLDKDGSSERIASLVKLNGEYLAVIIGGKVNGGAVVKHEHAQAMLDSDLRAIQTRLTVEDLLLDAGAIVYKAETYNEADLKEVVDIVGEMNPDKGAEVVDMRAQGLTKETFTSLFA